MAKKTTKLRMKEYLLDHYDYIEKFAAIKKLQPLFSYIDGWLKLAISTYDSIEEYK